MIKYLSIGRTHTKKTAIVVEKIIRLTIETGALTALTAVLNLTLFLLPGGYYQGTIGILGKLYSNSMIVGLNSRMKIAPEINQSNGRGVTSSLVFDRPVLSTFQASRSLGQDGHQSSQV